MRALVQRVHRAEVEVAGEVVGRIDEGVLVYLGVGCGDTPARAERLAEKVAEMRIFQDEQGKMNRSVGDVRGGILAVPNFTLMADARKGRRPAFSAAAPPDEAEKLYQVFVEALRRTACRVETGVFGATMTVRSAAAGPVNIILDVTDPGG